MSLQEGKLKPARSAVYKKDTKCLADRQDEQGEASGDTVFKCHTDESEGFGEHVLTNCSQQTDRCIARGGYHLSHVTSANVRTIFTKRHTMHPV